MSYPFAEIILNAGAERYAFDKGFEGEKRLCSLAKVNLFVGANNSGKSRLMRVLAATERLRVWPNDEDKSWDSFIEILAGVEEEVKALLPQADPADVSRIRDCMRKFGLNRSEVEGDKEILQFDAALLSLKTLQPSNRYSHNGIYENTLRRIGAIAEEAHQELSSRGSKTKSIPQTKKLYIPTLRSLRNLGSGDNFSEQTRTDYFAGSSHVQVFTGRTLYSDIEGLVRGNLTERETLRKFETWIGEEFFQGALIAIIPRKNEPTLFIKIGDEEEQPIHKLGDGIQSILILAFPLFLRAEEDLLVFIEEPELFLHPWLQRVLLEMLEKRFERHQYFLTTHSNHFLDLTLDAESVSVFAFHKELEASDGKERPARYTVQNVSHGDRGPLELLGVRNSSVLLTNCTIWVEGITDRRYIAHWLDLYQQSLHLEAKEGMQEVGKLPESRAKFFKEDLHYSFVEYSGGNVTHWSFLDEEGTDVKRLCGKLFLIADNDDAKPDSAKGKRHEKLKEKLGDNFHLLPVREIENLLKPEILRLVLEAYKEKSENLKAPKQESYASKKLGKFIEEKFFKDPAMRKDKASYAAKSGTVNDKTKFCAHAIEAMKSFDDLSPHAQELTKKVHAFIKKENLGAAGR